MVVILTPLLNMVKPQIRRCITSLKYEKKSSARLPFNSPVPFFYIPGILARSGYGRVEIPSAGKRVNSRKYLAKLFSGLTGLRRKSTEAQVVSRSVSMPCRGAEELSPPQPLKIRLVPHAEAVLKILLDIDTSV
jgi:hypothetical protein